MRCWYAWLPGTNPSPLLNTNWRRLSPGIKPTCVNGPVLCAIYAPACGINPTSPFSANLQQYIADGLVTSLAQPQMPAGSKFYLYMKAS